MRPPIMLTLSLLPPAVLSWLPAQSTLSWHRTRLVTLDAPEGSPDLDLDAMLLSGMEENAKRTRPPPWDDNPSDGDNRGRNGVKREPRQGGRSGQWRGGDNQGGRRPSWGRDDGFDEGRPERYRGQIRAEREFGPTGHDYERDPNDSGKLPANQQVIDDLLAQRLQAKFRREYRMADELQEELWNIGIVVKESQRTWQLHQHPVKQSSPGSYVCGSPEEFLHDLDVAQIESFVEQRVLARRAGNYPLADTLRQDLAALGVTINDNKRLWYVQGPHGHPYKPTEEGFERYVDVDEVNALIAERYDAKIRKDYNLADEAHRKLKALGAGVDDRNFLWFVYHEERARLARHRDGDGERAWLALGQDESADGAEDEPITFELEDDA